MFRSSEPTSPLHPRLMCRSRKSTSASNPSSPPSPSPSSHHRHHHRHHHTSSSSTSSASQPSFTHAPPPTPTTTSTSTTSTSLDSTSLSSLRFSLSGNPVLYPFSELSAATNNFLSKRLSSSTSSSTSSSWKCTLRGKVVVVFQRNFRGNPSDIPSRLSAICRGHHSSIARLLGASLPSSASVDNIYLIYEHVTGASLQSCLRNPRNPNFTPLSKWISRIKIAADIAQGLEYMHIHCRTIHNRIKSSAVVVTDPDLGAKICHFGAADLAGEIPAEEKERGVGRSNSRRMRIEGTRGYIAPEVISGAAISMRSDVYAFGVVILELVSGQEPVRYVVEEGNYRRVSVIETAREAIGTEDEDGAAAAEAEERMGRVRRWVDRRLRDSFPVEAAERLIRVALRCVEEEAWMRPEMTWVAGKVSKLYLDSRAWAEKMTLPTDFSVSLAPR